MNELINKFRIMSTIEVEDIDSTEETFYRNVFDYEKFAELIVKETMQVVANNLPQNTYLDVADAVVKHFKE